MRKTVLVVSFAVVVVVLTRAQSRIGGTWQAEVQPNAFWTVELRSEGTRLTGSVGMGGDPVEISDGAIEGNTVSFKVESPDGDRIITFNGTVMGSEIAFTREVQVRQGGFAGGPGIFGAAGARTFTVTRVPDGQAPKKGRGTSFPNQLTVFDRNGKVVRNLGEPDSYFQPKFSPDGTKLAVALRGDIWTFDVARGTRTRVTSTPRAEFSPVWSPDGRYIAYSAFRQSVSRLYRTPSDGTGTEVLLFENMPGVSMTLTDWSADGRWLTFTSGGVLFTVPVDGERKAKELAREEFSMTGGRFSPDSRFLAYRSDESGQWEVFVRAFDGASGFPPAGGKWQVSNGGLGMNYWRRDGRELFYLGADGGVMAVDVSTSPTVQIGPPRQLFRAPDSFPLIFTPGALGSVARDGRRIALAVPVAPQRKAIAVAPDILSKYTGTYELFGSEVKMVLEGNQLVMRVFNERIPLFAQSETSFFAKMFSDEIDFIEDEQGAVTHFLFYQGGPATKAVRR